ncbi:hypothetical protein DR950_33210 [Kitasatospora xanthocidica]|uniref:Histone n=1 Tax=Kitasatospora xanthocidica TaxID=83382 RepID=A0A373A1E0_9ACTN|nr:hypothetical protein [Kitasatospora xanthocidica]RGD61953.1 hypothetical protein DR950_33210 [Kitasatospora xanthocidica]
MVETAAGVVEEVGKLVVGTASSILEKAGVDVAGVERRLGGQFPPSVETLQTLAGEAVTAGRAGVDLAVGVARNEAEKVFERVGDQVTKVGVVLAYLETKLREVEEEAPAAASGPGAYGAEEPVPAPRAGDLFGRGWEAEEERSAARTVGEPIVAERVEVDEPVEVDPPVPPVPRVSPVAPVRREEPAAEESSAGKSSAGKAAAEKSTAKKATPAKKTPAKKTSAKTTQAGKAAAKRTTTVKKSATPRQAEAGTEPGTPAKRAATRKTTVRKATSTKKPGDPKKSDDAKKPDARDE